ncbi:MAG TPA: hypothetical protein VFR90_17090 [Methylibium sp.]|uniref:hypothetical protein n=1 Tax=Methylibium sp. TaxID=2067992 RepID=UPI002DB65672|nr:hypothetical protein [Methylibium sp.]HEU4460839.1 hypothetical protein [Methylibium sp.]
MAYHVAAHAVGDPVASPRRFADAAATVHDVRMLLKYGRGNVAADSEPSRGHNGIGSSVAESGHDTWSQLAMATQMGAGVCDQHAGLTLVHHAHRMRDGDVVSRTGGRVTLATYADGGDVVDVQSGHSWGELRVEGRRDPESTAVLDGWSNGPVVRLKDSAWAGVVPNADLPLDKSQAVQQATRYETLVPLVHPDEDDYVAGRLLRKRREPTVWPRHLEAQVVSQAFAQRARDALADMSASDQRSLAASMAARTYGLSESQASSPRTVDAVLHEARSLDRQSRPPIEPPQD